MSVLFTPLAIRSLTMRNRFVRSATYDGLARADGHISDRQMRLYNQLAQGGVGLIVTCIASVHPMGILSTTQNSIAGDEFIPGWSNLADIAHAGGAKIAMQLFHAGREASGALRDRGITALAPSQVETDPWFEGDCVAMSEAQIKEVIQAFGAAAARCRRAGFDAAQIHAAHAYLFSQFLSPRSNRRQDRWGGSLENRLRLHREVLHAMRAHVGDDYPILIKLGVEDGYPGGLTFDEGRLAAQNLTRLGYDAVEVSQGLRGKRWGGTEFRTGIKGLEEEAYFRAWCAEITRSVSVPTMMVGGLRSFGLMEEAIQQREAHMVSMCRPFIREPGLVRDWAEGDRHRSRCVSCNGCLTSLRHGLRCVQEEKRSSP